MKKILVVVALVVSAMSVMAQDFSNSEIGTSVNNTELTQLRSEVAQLRNEVAVLRSEVEQLKNANNSTSSKSTQATTKTTNTSSQQNGDVTFVKYEHSLLDPDARLSLKNNTNKVITSITWRIIYYDMSGNMLDYHDFTESTTIDPGMVRSIEIDGFRWSDSYVYHDDNESNAGTKYKIQLELKSYETE
jgi:hypothetical protein